MDLQDPRLFCSIVCSEQSKFDESSSGKKASPPPLKEANVKVALRVVAVSDIVSWLCWFVVLLGNNKFG